MKKYIFLASVLVLVIVGLVVSQGFKRISEVLIGYEEVPAVSTAAQGQFSARISNDESQITYELTYSGLEGNVQQAHIHFGQTSVNGAIIVWLCGNPNPPAINPPPGTQLCPASPATITGTITAAEVTGQPAGPPAGQGIQSGEFEELLRAIRTGHTYVNVHTTKFPGGEVRSQIAINKDHSDH